MKEDLTKLLMQSYDEGVKDALDSVKEALAQPAQEPITVLTSAGYIADEDDDIQVYQRPWVGLTDEEIEVIEALKAPPVHPDFVDCDDWMNFARAIEAKLKEKNHG